MIGTSKNGFQDNWRFSSNANRNGAKNIACALTARAKPKEPNASQCLPVQIQ
jgi:hypothetical protein